jgi:hypothetical protein
MALPSFFIQSEEFKMKCCMGREAENYRFVFVLIRSGLRHYVSPSTMHLGTFPALKKKKNFPTLRKSLPINHFHNTNRKKAVPPR